MTHDKEVLNLNEFCELTGYKPATVYVKKSKNEFPANIFLSMPGSRFLRFRRSEVEKWMGV